MSLVSLSATPVAQDARSAGTSSETLEESRLAMSKWIETQQILSRERKEWQQGKEVLASRVDLVKLEIRSLEEQIERARADAAKNDEAREKLLAEERELGSTHERLVETVAAMEADVRKLCSRAPESVRARIEPLRQRMPEGTTSRASVAERMQNVLGILNELNKANNEISVNFEVRELSGGKPAEVRVVYVGLAQAYYVSASGEAGIGRPSESGWTWQSAQDLGPKLLLALEILEGKHTPEFVPLPARIE